MPIPILGKKNKNLCCLFEAAFSPLYTTGEQNSLNKSFLQVKKAQFQRADISCLFLVRCFGELGFYPFVGLGVSSAACFVHSFVLWALGKKSSLPHMATETEGLQLSLHTQRRPWIVPHLVNRSIHRSLARRDIIVYKRSRSASRLWIYTKKCFLQSWSIYLCVYICIHVPLDRISYIIWELWLFSAICLSSF